MKKLFALFLAASITSIIGLLSAQIPDINPIAPPQVADIPDFSEDDTDEDAQMPETYTDTLSTDTVVPQESAPTREDTLNMRIRELEIQLEGARRMGELKSDSLSEATATISLLNGKLAINQKAIRNMALNMLLWPSNVQAVKDNVEDWLSITYEPDSTKVDTQKGISLLNNYETHTQELYNYLKGANRELKKIYLRRSHTLKAELHGLDVYKEYHTYKYRERTYLYRLMSRIEAVVDDFERNGKDEENALGEEITILEHINPNLSE